MSFASEHPVSYLVGTTTRTGQVILDQGGSKVLVGDDAVSSTQRWLPRAALKDLAPPAPTPTPVPVPPAPTEAPVWDGSADKGLGVWGQVQDGRDPQFGNSSISIVAAPWNAAVKAFKFVVNQITGSSNGPRAELADSLKLVEGDDWWFGDVLYVPKASWRFASGQGHHTVMQFKNEGTGSPPLNLDIRRWSDTDPNNGLLTQAEEPAGTKYRVVVPLVSLFDRPIPVEIHVKFSSDPNVGFYEVWADGKQVIAPVKMATLRAGLTDGLKIGQYGEADGNVSYWQGTKRGKTRVSVLR